jgi:DNA polymerase-3 subunit delta'
MQALTADEVAGALRERWQVEPKEAREIAALANGRLGWAVRAHERPVLREARRQQLDVILSLPAASRDERLRRAADLSVDADTARRALELWTLWWRDVTLAANGATRLETTGKAREAALAVGSAVGPDRAHAFLRSLLEAQAALDSNANARLTLEVLMLDLPVVPASSSRR